MKLRDRLRSKSDHNIVPNRLGISPVIGVVLLVVITVTIAGVVGFFAVGLNENTNDTGQAGLTTQESQDEYQVQVVDSGNIDELSIRVNGTEVESKSTSSGEVFDVSEFSQLCGGDTVTLVGVSDGTETVLNSDTVQNDVDCQLQGTNTNSTATYDGSSWIVKTSLENTSSGQQYYVISLSDGDSTQVTNTVTLQSGESKTIESTTNSYSETDPITVGVSTPDQKSTEYTLVGGSASTNSNSTTADLSGGSEAGNYYYQPDGADGTTVSSPDYNSGFAKESGSDEPSFSLSSSRASTGETIQMFATLTTTKSPEAEETLQVFATETNSSSTLISESTHTIQEGENKLVTNSFSINNTGQYIISTSLKGSAEIYEVGTVNITSNSAITFESGSVIDEDGDGQFAVNEQVTLKSDLKNSGSNSETVTVEFFQDGTKLTSSEVTVNASSTKTVSETVTPTEEGNISFHIGVIEPAIVERLGEKYVSSDSSVSVSVSHSPTEPSTGETVTFTANADHSDSSVSIDEYQWSFDDGTNSTTTSDTYTRTFDKDGQYIEYTVTAVAGNGDSQTTGGSIRIPYDSQTVNLIDNFESSIYEDNSETLDSIYNTESYISRTTNKSHKGSYSIKLESDGGSYPIYSDSGSGLPAYPEPGDTITARYYAETSGEPQKVLLFGGTASNDAYGVEINNDSADWALSIAVYDQGTRVTRKTVGSGDVTERGAWQKLVVDWATDGTITAELYDSSGNLQYSVSITDTTHSSGGIGFRSGASQYGTGYFDTVKISN